MDVAYEKPWNPSGALDPLREKRQRRMLLFLILLVVAAVLGIFAWRKGWFEKMLAGTKAVSAVKPVANPHGWV